MGKNIKLKEQRRLARSEQQELIEKKRDRNMKIFLTWVVIVFSALAIWLASTR